MKKNSTKYIALGTCLSLVPNAIQAQKIDRTLKPEPLELNFEPQIGEYQTFIAENGVKVFLIRKEGFPKFRINFSFRLPSFYKDADIEASNISSELIQKGAGYLENDELKDQILEIGGDYIASKQGYVLSGLKEDAEAMLALFAPALKVTDYTAEQVEKVRQKKLDELEKKSLAPKEEEKKKSDWDSTRNSHEFFIHEKKENQASASVYKKLTDSDIEAYRQLYYGRKNCFAIISGDFTPKEINKLFKKHFDGWFEGQYYEKESELDHAKKAQGYVPTTRKIYVKDKPLAVQASISFTWPTCDLYPYAKNNEIIKMLGQVFGENYNSYLNRNLRLDKGLCYFVRGSVAPNGSGGTGNVNTKVRTNLAGYAVENILFEMYRLRNEDIPLEDYNMVRNGLLGDHAMTMSSLASPIIIGFGMMKEQYNLPDNYLVETPKRLKAVTIKDIRKAAEQYLKPDECIIYIEGEIKGLKGQLEKFGEVHYFDKDGKRID